MTAFFGSILGALKLVPKWIWYLLAAAALWHFALSWHGRQIKDHDRKVIAERDAYWSARIEAVAKQARDIRAKAEATSAAITEKVRNDHESQARIIAADAGALRVSGPGKAAAGDCRSFDHPSLPSGASGARGSNPATNAAGSQDASAERAVVPWNWLVNRAEQHDTLRSEVLAWRSWYQQQAAAWEKMRAAKP